MIFDKSVICPILIGHENDLQLLDRLIMQSRGGSGQIALISGEAGIGKSRLVKEAKEKVQPDTLILKGHCFQTEAAVPYAPLLDLFRTFFAINSFEEVAAAMGSSASELVRLFPDLTVHLPDVNTSPQLDARQDKRRLFQALVQVFIEFAQRHSLMIIIEDLHWSDPTSLEFLLLLARRISAYPILLIITYRSDETTPELTHFLAELDRERLGTEFVLKQMSLLEVDVMLQAILDLKTPVSKEFLGTIFPLTEGNPFFIEEILKALIADGDVFYANGTWDRKEINQLRIPRSVQDAVQRRINQLDGNTLQALTHAAVMGRRFDFGLLQDLLGVKEEGLLVMLKRLAKAQLVVEESADEFAFRHALTREAIYTTLLLRERQGIHRTVGEAMERLYAASINLHLADLSYHFYTGGVWQKALEYSLQAGAQAHALYAQREAIVYYSRALTSAQQLGMVIEPGLLNARGHAYEILGDFKSALDDFEQALRISQQEQDGHAEWQTLIDLGFLWAGRDYQKTGEFFRRAEVIARNLNEPKLHAHSLNRVGNWFLNIGQTMQGLQCHRQAIEIFEEAQDEHSIAVTRDLLGMATLHHGDQIGSYDEYQQAIRLFRKMDDKHGLVSALIGACHASFWDETDFVPPQTSVENQRVAMEALELARQIGWTAGQAYVEWSIAIGLANRGLFGKAIAHAKESLEVATEIEHRQWITGAHYALGHIYVLMLQSDLAIQNLEKGLTLAKELGSAWWIGNITTELANSYLINGDPGRVRLLLDSVLVQDDRDYTMVERRMRWARGNLLLTANKPAEALKIADQLLALRCSIHERQPIPALMKLRGEAWIALNQFEKAEQDLEQAKKGAEQRQALPLLWRIHYQLGRLHKGQKNTRKMEKEFACAHLVVRNLAANIEDEQLRERFVRSVFEILPPMKIISERQNEAEKFGGLTYRERDVARYLALGISNREIAEKLVLSERTIENHVGNILTKLGFTSRAQVAVWVVEKGWGREKTEYLIN